MNKLSNLAEKLILDLQKGAFFKTKKILVPSIKMEAFFKSYFLKNKDEVLMNVEFIDIRKGLFSLFDNDLKLASNNQIRNIIIKYLNNNTINELNSYLSESNNRLKGIKIYDIADNLASVFNEYDDDLFEASGYQKVIYDYVKKELFNNGLVTLKMLYENNAFVNKDTIYLFGFHKYSNLEKAILNKYANTVNYELDINDLPNPKSKIKYLVKAPNRLREIEYLHSTICELLKDKNNTFSDFLVLSSNMTSYEMEIKRVFNQDDEQFPNIPYYFNAPRNVENSSYSLINKLIEIGNKGYFNRLDFDNVISNSITRKIRNISDDDVDMWLDSIKDLNIYRKEDWTYLRLRLLTSKISDINDTDDVVQFNDFKSIPYSSIGLDDSSIVRFIQLIDDLNSFVDLYTSYELTTEAYFDLLNTELEKWLSLKEYNVEQNSYYVKIKELIDFWNNNQMINISTNSLFYSIINIVNRPRMNSGSLYSSGVSFSSFDTVLQAKYLFVIGASSENLPKIKTKNPLDIRTKEIDYLSEEIIFKLAINNSENIFFSYVDKDSKTLEEQYYVSNFVKPYIDKNLIIEMNLDENRGWGSLYTKKEFKNKIFNNNLLGSEIKNTSPIPLQGQVEELTIKTNKMAEFLIDPLQFKTNALFGRNNHDNNINNIFEPLNADSLTRSILFKQLVIEKIENGDFITTFERLLLENKLPHLSENISLQFFETMKNKVNDFIDDIEKNNEGAKLEVLKLNNIVIDKWIIIDDTPCLYLKNGGISKYFSIKEKKDIKDSLKLYTVSLMKAVIDDTFSIIDLNGEYSFKLGKAEALDLLKNICLKMNDYSDNKFYNVELPNDKVSQYNDVVDSVRGASSATWGRFQYKKLFDYYKQMGYDVDNIVDDYQKYEKEHLNLICYLSKKEGEEDESKQN